MKRSKEEEIMSMRKVLTLWLLAGVGSMLPAMSGALAEEFVVGVEVPLSGSLARVGTGMSEGINVAADVFNRKNGKHKIKLITVDDESSPAKAVAAVEKLASQGVVAIDGGYGSSNIGPASDAANKAGLVYITSGGVDEALTQRGLKTFFRINNTAGYSKAMLGLLADMGAKSVSIVYLTKEATSDLARDIEKALTAKGVKVTMHAFDPAITDFKPIINKIKLQDKPDVIVMSGYENDYVGILRAAKVLKPDVKAVVGAWSLATSKMQDDFPDLMSDVYGTALLPFPAEFTTPDGKDFAETYKKLYGKEPDYLGQFGYVQSQLLFDAIVRAYDAGTLKSGGIAAELRKSNQDTLIGRVQFDDKGDNPNFSHRMGQHQGKQIAVVWPKDYANGKMIFPGVPW
jgi:branched-chain amino acid transport system substrate-binding protein